MTESSGRSRVESESLISDGTLRNYGRDYKLLEKLTEKEEDASKDIDPILTNIEHFIGDFSSLKDSIEALKVTLIAQDKEILEKNDEISNLKENEELASKCYENEFQRNIDEIKSQTKWLNDLREKIDEAEKQVVSKDELIVECKRKIATQKNHLRDRKILLKAAFQLAPLEDELTKHEEQLSQLQRERDTSINVLKNLRDAQTVKIAEIKLQETQLEAEIVKLIKTNIPAQKTAFKFEREVQKKRDEIIELLKLLLLNQNKIFCFNDDLQAERRNNAVLLKKIKDKEDEMNEKLNLALKEKNDQIEELQKLNRALIVANKELKEDFKKEDNDTSAKVKHVKMSSRESQTKPPNNFSFPTPQLQELTDSATQNVKMTESSGTNTEKIQTKDQWTKTKPEVTSSKTTQTEKVKNEKMVNKQVNTLFDSRKIAELKQKAEDLKRENEMLKTAALAQKLNKEERTSSSDDDTKPWKVKIKRVPRKKKTSVRNRPLSTASMKSTDDLLRDPDSFSEQITKLKEENIIA